MIKTCSVARFILAAAGILGTSGIVGAQPVQEEIVHAFTGGTAGSHPSSPLVEGLDGAFYGTADGAGYHPGVAYRLTRDGTYSVLHTFGQLGPETTIPTGPTGLMLAGDGMLYGMTRYGGPYGQGTIYRMTHAGEVTFLHDFAGGASDGVVPQETLTQATDGNFYGVTGGGGAFNRGTAFRMTPAGAVTILHHFAGGPSDGARPGAALVQAPDGNFYGTTNFGGALGYGTVFRMTPDGTVTVLRSMYAFDGDYSLLWLARLTVGADGELYGVHPSNTDGPRGSEIFRIAPDGSYTVLHAFQHSVDGWPHGALALADDGNLYGWSTYGVFRITPSGRYTLVHARTPWEVGYPGGLLQTSDGDLYASTSASDVQQWGSVFRLRGLECPYSHTASPSQVSVGGSGGATVIAIATRPGCSWTPSSTAPWLTVLDSGTRTGSGTFTVVVAPRRGSGTRTGFLTGGGATLALTVTQAAGGGRPYDLSRWNLDGDRRTDIAVWRPGNGTWFTLHSTTLGEWSSPTWGTGAANDRPVPGDYDGDGRGDPAVWRPGNGFWYILTSRSNYTASMWIQWGTGGENDVPVPADYDGDGATDVAVWRPGTGTWYVKTSSRGFTGSFNVDWGQGSLGDRPVVADYDGDGRADLAVYRPSAGMWYFLLSHINYSRSHPFIRQWGGAAGDEPLVGDFDGDGMSDLGIWRPSLARWYLLLSSANFLYAHARDVFLGEAPVGDVPLTGDYDGDGRTDLVLWRPSTGRWYIRRSITNYADRVIVFWGNAAAQDVPIPPQ